MVMDTWVCGAEAAGDSCLPRFILEIDAKFLARLYTQATGEGDPTKWSIKVKNGCELPQNGTQTESLSICVLE